MYADAVDGHASVLAPTANDHPATASRRSRLFRVTTFHRSSRRGYSEVRCSRILLPRGSPRTRGGRSPTIPTQARRRSLSPDPPIVWPGVVRSIEKNDLLCCRAGFQLACLS